MAAVLYLLALRFLAMYILSGSHCQRKMAVVVAVTSSS